MINHKNKIYASFRDPSGYLFTDDKNRICRRINPVYFKQYEHFMNSGLYNELVSKEYIISHEELEKSDEQIILSVKKIPFISYPYEWSFDQLKDSAILTLKVMLKALDYGMCLKDASAYNIQFLDGKPIFIDTLSFDFFQDKSWTGYGQFCRHFLAPLLLMSYIDNRSNCMLKDFIDGIPLDMASKILGRRGGLVAKMHIKWHSKAINKYNSGTTNNKLKTSFCKQSLVNMINMMIRQINKLSLKKDITEWQDYYSNTNYIDSAFESKKTIVEQYLKDTKLTSHDIAFDIGANDGTFSYLATKHGCLVVSFDSDYNCVNNNYNNSKQQVNGHILPLVIDFTNPSPDLGFANCERDSLLKRGNAKCVMALAVIHHICISNNVSFEMLANWLKELGEYLIIEFVPKSDSKVQKLLETRDDIFISYTQENFEKVFENFYIIKNHKKVSNSQRTIYYMRKKHE